MALSTLRYSLPQHKKNDCWFNAANNLRHYQLNGKNLHLVFGSYISYTTLPLRDGDAQFYGTRPLDTMRWEVDEAEMWRDYLFSHGWLEDDDGNIYDYVFEGTKKNTLIEGVSKAEMARNNYHYYPAPPLLQHHIHTCLMAGNERTNLANNKMTTRIRPMFADEPDTMIPMGRDGEPTTMVTLNQAWMRAVEIRKTGDRLAKAKATLVPLA